MLPENDPISKLFPLIQAGSRQAFDELFKSRYVRLTMFARQYTGSQEAAEDITTEVFIKLWLKRSVLNRVINPDVYLYTAIKNTALNYLRSAKKHAALTNEITTGKETASMPLHNGKELQRVIDELVAKLPEQRRLCFVLIKENGLKSRQAAAILGILQRISFALCNCKHQAYLYFIYLIRVIAQVLEK